MATPAYCNAHYSNKPPPEEVFTIRLPANRLVLGLFALAGIGVPCGGQHIEGIVIELGNLRGIGQPTPMMYFSSGSKHGQATLEQVFAEFFGSLRMVVSQCPLDVCLVHARLLSRVFVSHASYTHHSR